jgi:general secretion pathway protein A
MNYFKVLGFEDEPFSTSPDPDFFYLSKEHETALTNILIELRLKRGYLLFWETWGQARLLFPESLSRN